VKPRFVNCPQCGEAALFASENPFRPFCCERCRLLDLGAWAEEQYRVPVHEMPDLQDQPTSWQ